MTYEERLEEYKRTARILCKHDKIIATDRLITAMAKDMMDEDDVVERMDAI